MLFAQMIQPLLERRNHQHGQVGMCIREAVRQFLAAQPGMREVGDQQVRQRLLDDLPCLVTVLALDNFCIRPVRMDDRPDGFAHFRNVVEEDDAKWMVRAAGGGLVPMGRLHPHRLPCILTKSKSTPSLFPA
jgi:hypothetical protein